MHLYLSTDGIPQEPEEVANATAILDTLKTHDIVRGLSKHGIPCLKFFFLSNGKEPHYTQWCGPECGHADNSVDENTCAFSLRNITSVLTWNGYNVQFVKAGSTKSVFSVDMYIDCLVEVQNFRFNLVNFS